MPCTITLLFCGRPDQPAIQMVCADVYTAWPGLFCQRTGRGSFTRTYNGIVFFIYQAIYMEKYRPFTTLVWHFTDCTFLRSLVLSCAYSYWWRLDTGLFLRA